MWLVIHSIASACVCLCVCLSVCPVCAQTSESLDLETSFWGADVSLDYLRQVYISMSLSQGQDHWSQKLKLVI